MRFGTSLLGGTFPYLASRLPCRILRPVWNPALPGDFDAFPSAFPEYNRPIERIVCGVVNDDVSHRPRCVILRERPMIPTRAIIARAEDTVDVDIPRFFFLRPHS